MEDGAHYDQTRPGIQRADDPPRRGNDGAERPGAAPVDLRVRADRPGARPAAPRSHAGEYDELWDVFKPRGRVDATVHVFRRQAGEPVDLSATVYCRDVAAVYRHFQYPLDHLTGQLTLEKNDADRRPADLERRRPAPAPDGTIQNPGVDAVVQLDIQADAIPIDDALKKRDAARRAQGRRPV